MKSTIWNNVYNGLIVNLVLSLLLILVSFTHAKSQNNSNIDSLLLDYKKHTQDTARIKTLLNLGIEYEAVKPDSGLFYYNKAVDIANGILNKKKSNFDHKYINKIISLKSEVLLNIGNVQYLKGLYDKSSNAYYEALKYFELISDTSGMSKCYNNLGLIHFAQKDYEEAANQIAKSLELDRKFADSLSVAKGYSNLGIIYKNQGKFKQAFVYYQKALSLRLLYNDTEGVANCYNNLGSICIELAEYNKSEEYLLKAIDISKHFSDNRYHALGLANLAMMLERKADSSNYSLQEKKADLYKAADYARQAVSMTTLPFVKAQTARFLMRVLNKIGQYKEAMQYADTFITIQDTLFSQEKTKALAEMQTKYEAEKNALEIDNLNKKNALKEAELSQSEEKRNKQLVLIYSFIVGFIIILFFSIIIFRLFIQKKKANIILADQKEQIEIQNSMLNQANEEITAQRDLVTLQKEQIEIIHHEVTSSINYAKRIQEAVLPVSVEARSILGEHFILFKPKDIVSGDFYWTTKIDKWLIIAVADCTGHGVPGAFMSMLGISFLNEIVQKKEVHKASQILNILRSEVINALQQKGTSGEQKDGMDISLLVINTESNEAQWAGANNPLYVIARSETSKQSLKEIPSLSVRDDEEELYELKGDKMPIAIYPQMKDFTNHEFVLNKGDLVYLFTDGYADQFGGLKGRKFMYKQFKEILIQNISKSMNEQKLVLEKAFYNWKSGYEQIDDVTVVGIKI